MTTMENTILQGLIGHFGSANALRIYACGTIMANNSGVAIDESVVRMTIGALKRIRRDNGWGIMPWSMAIEQLEAEQDEGRHYRLGPPSPIAIEAARIGQVNQPAYRNPLVKAKAKAKAAVKAACIQAIHTRVLMAQEYHNQDMDTQAIVAAWVDEYWQTISNTKRCYLHAAISAYRAREAISEDVRKNISKRYTPKGVKPMEFLELLARYVA
jgi:hypothetical protein